MRAQRQPRGRFPACGDLWIKVASETFEIVEASCKLHVEAISQRNIEFAVERPAVAVGLRTGGRKSEDRFRVIDSGNGNAGGIVPQGFTSELTAESRLERTGRHFQQGSVDAGIESIKPRPTAAFCLRSKQFCNAGFLGDLTTKRVIPKRRTAVVFAGLAHEARIWAARVNIPAFDATAVGANVAEVEIVEALGKRPAPTARVACVRYRRAGLPRQTASRRPDYRADPKSGDSCRIRFRPRAAPVSCPRQRSENRKSR